MTHVKRQFIGIAIGSVLLGASSLSAAASCDQSCLLKTLHSYLAQLAKQDAKSVSASATIVAVENGQSVKLGDGSWQHVTAVPGGLEYADASTGQAVYAGAVKRGDQVGALYLRLKVQNGKITESEMFTRGGEPGATTDFSGLLEPDLIYDTTVPEARRSDRAKLQSVVEAYLSAISKHDGSLAPFSYRCDRYSAGSKFTNNPAVTVDHGGGSCPSSLNGLKGQAVVNTRIAVIDVPKGIVCVEFIIPHGERAMPNATNVAEVFKIVDGKIRSIEEYSYVGVFPANSGFAQ